MYIDHIHLLLKDEFSAPRVAIGKSPGGGEAVMSALLFKPNGSRFKVYGETSKGKPVKYRRMAALFLGTMSNRLPIMVAKKFRVAQFGICHSRGLFYARKPLTNHIPDAKYDPGPVVICIIK